MQLASRKKNKKLKIAIPIIVSAVLVLSATYILVAKPFSGKTSSNTPKTPVNTVDYGPPSEEEKAASGQQKEDIIKDYETSQNGDQAPGAITVSVSLASQAGAGQDLNVRALVEGATSGECMLTLTRQGQATITKSLPLVFEATSSRCQGADISAGEFSQSGEWNLSIVVWSGKLQSNTVQQLVTITK